MSTRKLLLHNRNLKVIRELQKNNQGIDEVHFKEKLAKMSASPYIFFRGSNHLYWEDFYNDWRITFFGATAETLTWINGDAHIYNYGAYANHKGQAIFCMDDFDDSIVADYQFDLWRMAISIVLDCRENNVFEKKDQEKALIKFARAYWKQLINQDDDIDGEVHLTSKSAEGLIKKFLKDVEKKKSRTKMLNKWTILNDNKRVFNTENPKLAAVDKKTFKSIEKAIKEYRGTLSSDIQNDDERFRIKDIAARQGAGTGSLGSKRYYVLLEGDDDNEDDDIILDIKEQTKPPLYVHMSPREQAEFDASFPNQAERHAYAYKALAEHPDKYLGWLEMAGKHYSVKERSPFKADFPSEELKKKDDLFFMAKVWGDILAMRHKRASYELNDDSYEMSNAFASLIHNREEDFEKLIQHIAFEYADCVKMDHEILLQYIAE